MGHCLRVRSDLVVLVVRQVDVARIERREDLLDEADVLVVGAMLDDDLRKCTGQR